MAVASSHKSTPAHDAVRQRFHGTENQHSKFEGEAEAFFRMISRSSHWCGLILRILNLQSVLQITCIYQYHGQIIESIISYLLIIILSCLSFWLHPATSVMPPSMEHPSTGPFIKSFEDNRLSVQFTVQIIARLLSEFQIATICRLISLGVRRRLNKEHESWSDESVLVYGNSTHWLRSNIWVYSSIESPFVGVTGSECCLDCGYDSYWEMRVRSRSCSDSDLEQYHIHWRLSFRTSTNMVYQVHCPWTVYLLGGHSRGGKKT